MKNLLPAFLPALALLALSGCASTGAISTSEDDGVYYSSRDRSTAVVRPAAAPAAAPAAPADEAANPDYNGRTASAAPNSGSTEEYYDEDYRYSRNRRTTVYYAPGVAYYAPPIFAPYTTLGYGWGGGFPAYGYGPGFYDPFFSPYYGFGPGVNVMIGFGRPWGYGFGNPYAFGGFYDPFFHDPYFYGNPYAYGGFYGRGFYGGRGGFYGGRGGYYGTTVLRNGNSFGGDRNGRVITSGPRTDRMTDGGRRQAAGTGSTATSNSISPGGRARTEARPATTPQPGVVQPGRADGRDRTETANAPAPAASEVAPTASDNATERYNRPRRIRAAEPGQPVGTEQPVAQPQPAGTFSDNDYQPTRRVRTRTLDDQPMAQPQGQQETAPTEGQRPRRSRFIDNLGAAPQESNGQAAPAPQERPMRQRSEQPERSYERPSYSAPAPAPSYGGGNNGGGGGRRGRTN